MRLAIFDFDGTLYSKDSLIEIWKFYIRKHPGLIIYFPAQVIGWILHKIRLISTRRFKEIFLLYLSNRLPGTVRDDLQGFWQQQYPNQFNPEVMKYLSDLKSTDNKLVCISASPDIFLKPICDILGMDVVLSTKLVYTRGKYMIEGENCKGIEKIRILDQHYNLKDVDIAYVFSDNREDNELRGMAQIGFQIFKGKVQKS